MRFLLYIFLFLAFIKPLCAQDSTNFWKHLSVEGSGGLFYQRTKYIDGYNYYTAAPISESYLNDGGNLNFGINYSFHPNYRLKENNNMSFLILGLNASIARFDFVNNIENKGSSTHTTLQTWNYSESEIRGVTRPFEIGINSKYLFRAGRVFFGINASINKGTYLNRKTTDVNVVYTKLYTDLWTGTKDYDTSRYTVAMNGYFGKKNYSSSTIGLIMGVRLMNCMLFAKEDYYYSNSYRYWRTSLGCSYFFN